MKKVKRIFLEEIWSFYQWIFLFIPGRVGHYIRGFFLSLFFKKHGKKITIKENVEIYHPENLIIGTGSGFGRNNVIDCIGGVTIGNNVRFGPNVMIATMNHAQIGTSIGSAIKEKKAVKIGDNTWIGNGVTILPGVEIGDNCIIAAGAVVTKTVQSNTTVGGIPAKNLNL